MPKWRGARQHGTQKQKNNYFLLFCDFLLVLSMIWFCRLGDSSLSFLSLPFNSPASERETERQREGGRHYWPGHATLAPKHVTPLLYSGKGFRDMLEWGTLRACLRDKEWLLGTSTEKTIELSHRQGTEIGWLRVGGLEGMSERGQGIWKTLAELKSITCRAPPHMRDAAEGHTWLG